MLFFIIFRHRCILLFNFPYHTLPIRETEDTMPVKFFGQAFSINPFQCFCYHPFYVFGKQAVEKPLVNIKNGVAGAKPPTGSRGDSPFPGERGLGIGIEDSHYLIKNRLFLQSDRLTLTGKPVCFLHSEQACPFYSPPAMIYSRQYIRKRHFLLYFPYFLISR